MNTIAKTARIAIAVALLAAAVPADAQYADQYYHRVGDTIEWKANNGYFAWWEFETFFEEGISSNVWFSYPCFGCGVGKNHAWDTAILLQKFYTPLPLKIIGVAASATQGWRRLYEGWHVDTSDIPEYFLIYDVDSTSFTLKSKTKWNPFDPHRTVHIKQHVEHWVGVDSCCNPSLLSHNYFPIYEYYFDSAFYVTDSFYVGGTYDNDYLIDRVDSTTSQISSVQIEGQRLCPTEMLVWNGHCYPADITYKGYGINNLFDPFGDKGWWWASTNNLQTLYPLLIYPIVEVDTTVPPVDMCVPVSNVEVMVADTSCATVTWDGFPNYTAVTLRYGPANQPMASWTPVDVTDLTMYQICDFNHDLPRYGVQLKAVCDKKEMPWSEPVYFYTPADTGSGGPEGIAAPTRLSEQTFLQPNPASDAVTISSSFNLSRIELHDAAGILVYSEATAGHMTTIDIGFLRSGTYIVTIHTHDGITHKRLIVTR